MLSKRNFIDFNPNTFYKHRRNDSALPTRVFIERCVWHLDAAGWWQAGGQTQTRELKEPRSGESDHPRVDTYSRKEASTPWREHDLLAAFIAHRILDAAADTLIGKGWKRKRKRERESERERERERERRLCRCNKRIGKILRRWRNVWKLCMYLSVCLFVCLSV